MEVIPVIKVSTEDAERAVTMMRVMICHAWDRGRIRSKNAKSVCEI
jgi:hypothetical protein